LLWPQRCRGLRPSGGRRWRPLRRRCISLRRAWKRCGGRRRRGGCGPQRCSRRRCAGLLCTCRRGARLLRRSCRWCRRLWWSGVGERPGCLWGARRRLRRLGWGCRNRGRLRSGVHAGGRRRHALRRRCGGGGVPILRESGEGVEDVRAAPAANITLRHAQIRRGNDERQGALWADRKHYS
jgi:hypothetical protein